MTARNTTRKLIGAHTNAELPAAGGEVALHIDQTLTQDATGTLVMLELEGFELDSVSTELSVQYVDHNLLQEDSRNPDDHEFLRSACERFGVWFSRPGNGVSHPLHQAHFGVPGKTLLGSDSHTCAAGALGMLAIGAGGIEVAQAMAGEPYRLSMPEVMGVKLTGTLPPWVSAKDVILEMLRRHGVSGGVGKIIEYYGPGLESLSAMDRHVIANMGAELGATTSVFPSDDVTRDYLAKRKREEDWQALEADAGAEYDCHDEIDLSQVEPLIAMPTSPGNVVPVSEVAGETIGQAYIGSSANPGYRDFAVAAHIVKGHTVAPWVSFDINPTTRELLESLARDLHLNALLHAGARLHQAGCNGCIGMGQAPATDRLSLRTVPRNFPGRSGTREDRVALCSPETAAASALAGCIADPRETSLQHAKIGEPDHPVVNQHLFVAPKRESERQDVELIKGPNVKTLPRFEPLPDSFELPLRLQVGDDVSTDEIMPAGAEVLPYRSNIPAIAEFVYRDVDADYARQAFESERADHAILGGENYGQGSSREHAALAPRYLGLRVVIAQSFARIHRRNLIAWGVLPLLTEQPPGKLHVELGSLLRTNGLHAALREEKSVMWTVGRGDTELRTQHDLSKREVETLLAGGVVNQMRDALQSA